MAEDKTKTMIKNMKQIFMDESCFGKLEAPWKRALLGFKKLSQDSNVTIFTTPDTLKALEAMLDKHFGRNVEKEFYDSVEVLNADGSQKLDKDGRPVFERKKRMEKVRELEVAPVYKVEYTDNGKIGFLNTVLKAMSWDTWVLDTKKNVIAGLFGMKDYNSIVEFKRQLNSGFMMEAFLIADTNDWQNVVKVDEADLREVKPTADVKKLTTKSVIT